MLETSICWIIYLGKTLIIYIVTSYDDPPNQSFSSNFKSSNGHLLILGIFNILKLTKFIIYCIFFTHIGGWKEKKKKTKRKKSITF